MEREKEGYQDGGKKKLLELRKKTRGKQEPRIKSLPQKEVNPPPPSL
jgi:hypothetical protein